MTYLINLACARYPFGAPATVVLVAVFIASRLDGQTAAEIARVAQ